jgi:ribulose kinase
MIWTISDLHLSFAQPKPMDIFGTRWKDHHERIAANWRARVAASDTVLIAGDISWAMKVDDALEDLSGQSISTIRVVGGGSQNRLLCQLTADACGREVVAGPVEATALGNLLMQAIAVGELPDIAAGRRLLAEALPLERYEPRSTERWDAALERFARLT